MKEELTKFDIFADAKAKQTEIRWNIFLSIMFSVLTLCVLIPLNRFGLYSRGSAETVYVDGNAAVVLSLLSAALFGYFAYLFMKQLPKLRKEMDEEPMLYSFNEVGFTSHISGETHVWNDFKTFYYGKAGLHLPYKKKRGTSLVLGPSGISSESYVRIQKHLRAVSYTHLRAHET